jgi:hypothetical protein
MFFAAGISLLSGLSSDDKKRQNLSKYIRLVLYLKLLQLSINATTRAPTVEDLEGK